MRAVLRWKMTYLAGVLLGAAAAAGAQTVPDSSNNAPATDAVGPRELQNFSLPGTTTRSADQPSQPAPAPATRDTVRAEPKTQAPEVAPVGRKAVREASREINPPVKTETAPAKPLAGAQLPAAAQVAVPAAPAPSFGPAPLPSAPPAPALAPERRPLLLPWIIAALALAAGAFFFLWRRSRGREALVDGPSYDDFAAPEAAPAPAPRPPAPAAPPAPRPQARTVPAPEPARSPASPPRPVGIVASGLRPSIELAMQPLRCLVDDDEVTIEFEVEIFNAGTAPARAVIAEATLFNAGATHEQELAAFYAKPPAGGDRIDSIAPMRRMTFTNRVVAPRAQVQEYELAGRKSFVPVLAFNALYEWSGGKGQSSLAYLLGRETRSDKLGPLHLDGSRRELRGLAARVLPTAVRT